MCQLGHYRLVPELVSSPGCLWTKPPGDQLRCCLTVVDEARLPQEQPEFVVILPWNLRTEVMEQLAYIRDWGGKFVCAVPTLVVQ